MHRTCIKICGLTRPQDAGAAIVAGADALGVVLAPSRRQVTIEKAVAVLGDAPPTITRIGVFVNAAESDVEDAVSRIGLSAVQFHGEESPERCAAAPAPVIKAFRVGPSFDARVMDAYRGSVTAVLLDAYVPGVPGGTGVAFNWQEVAESLPEWAAVVLAGGLEPANVAAAVLALKPFCVDVSSGVEESPGVKDPRLIEEFVAAVRAADQEVLDV